MSRSEANKRWVPLLLVGLLASQLVLMSVTARRSSPVDGTEQTVFSAWMLAVVTPIQSAFGSLFGGTISLWQGYVDLRGVRERNAELEAENGRLRAENEAAIAEAAENARLRELQALRPMLKYQSVVAEVVARETSAWFKRVTVDKGTLSGVRLNHPVVTADGLVGRVTAVGPNAAQIQLITDEHAGAGGLLTTSRAAGEIKGRGTGRCVFKSISSIQQVNVGEGIVTSGLDRIFPAGILIGYVESVTPSAGASPQDIVVRPAAALDRVEEVLILLVEPRDLATPEGIR